MTDEIDELLEPNTAVRIDAYTTNLLVEEVRRLRKLSSENQVLNGVRYLISHLCYGSFNAYDGIPFEDRKKLWEEDSKNTEERIRKILSGEIHYEP